MKQGKYLAVLERTEISYEFQMKTDVYLMIFSEKKPREVLDILT